MGDFSVICMLSRFNPVISPSGCRIEKRACVCSLSCPLQIDSWDTSIGLELPNWLCPTLDSLAIEKTTPCDFELISPEVLDVGHCGKYRRGLDSLYQQRQCTVAEPLVDLDLIAFDHCVCMWRCVSRKMEA